MGASMETQKTENWSISCDSAIQMLSIYSNGIKSEFEKQPETPIFIAAQLILGKTWDQHRHTPIEEWIKKNYCTSTLWNMT